MTEKDKKRVNPAKAILEAAAAADAGQTAGEDMALQHYGAAGRVRSGEWIQKNLGASGLTAGELGARYYVPGMRADAEAARGDGSLRMADVKALDKADLDRAAVLHAVTESERQLKTHAVMLTGTPSERMTLASDPRRMNRADSDVLAGSALAEERLGRALSEGPQPRRPMADARTPAPRAMPAGSRGALSRPARLEASAWETPVVQTPPELDRGHFRQAAVAQEALARINREAAASALEAEKIFTEDSAPVRKFIQSLETVLSPKGDPRAPGGIDATLGLGGTAPSVREGKASWVAGTPAKDTPAKDAAAPGVDAWDVISPGVPRTGVKAVDAVNALIGGWTVFGAMALGARKPDPGARGSFSAGEMKAQRAQAKREGWFDPFEAARARAWLIESGRTGDVLDMPVGQAIREYRDAKNLSTVFNRQSLLY